MAEQAQKALEDIELDDKAVLTAGKIQKALGNALSIKTRYDKISIAVADLDREIKDQEHELAELTEKVTEALGTYEACPTCGGGLDHVHS